MRESKQELILKALKDPDVEKTVEGIIRTIPNSDARRTMVEIFDFKFSEIVAKEFANSIVGHLDKRLNITANLTFGGKIELLSSDIYTMKKVISILIGNENFEFNVMLADKKIIIIQEVILQGNETYLISKFFFSGIPKEDKLIINALNALIIN